MKNDGEKYQGSSLRPEMDSSGGMGRLESPQSVLDKWVPAKVDADRWKSKPKLKTGFEVDEIQSSQPPMAKTAGRGDDPTIPPPKAPQKRENALARASQGVFAKDGNESLYFQDSHMVISKHSATKKQQDCDSGRTYATRRTLDRSRRTRKSRRFSVAGSSSSEEDDGDREYPRRDAFERASMPEGENATPKLDLATHRPLGQIRTFSEHRNKSERSMQWLRGFVYEMKGTRGTPDEWCMSFQLSLKDGALHWYRQLPKKTKRPWSFLSKAFIKYYCAQLDQTAETRYISAKRAAKGHCAAI
ncbi:Eukaryotic/viral aspartic protease [Phytophthora megakarya]|uniref:Eukaryotic/viral aspartic protease n=1 Tax=Phytophthora megakarya TaxID=4795 RepID=A0A225W7W3_9STRA|nr:Eukaryotic/viral aspartic protease [Phytophthora megakarya]